ncbi:XRE family transcriptional regulator [Roseibacterium sp. SDUM158016]|jgi:transcriptional regulator with XRE-family HTH domain|uniref:helix-turn-helix domain-containing protein n=1 Tax=Roseicyclus sediminis TaxID=2980997 RepID=UPI0021D04AFA|nr:XRE family transcriptional regulator [Roseibacterium sp. SDUM158016]MCU4652764.1 XRE family transcriptional regulator [Roseibacterium sp. SDUM158016]
MTAQGKTQGVPPESLETAIGRKVRALRQGLDVTLADLARSAELSVGMLSKIENGQTSPSLSTLKALAQALNVPISMFFQDFEERSDCSFVPAGQGVRIDRRGTKAGHVYELLGHSLRSATKIEPFLITIDEGGAPHATFQHPGHEFIYMLSGRIVYRHGDRRYPLGPGDALFFDALAPHGPEEMPDLPARYLSIIVTPPPD